ncbi:choline dehydrogenase [Nostoc sp. 'Peltigera membranacea cyanobiont' 210A]|uniref:GMC family oxidoreductase n=1 Tax=Nostoc sp. 'Peltigera membranacea cyanobiont' 210A TaxID=2014529 RepID=UPI000B9568B8|nr:GMC family oxidoreductase N-terminal domain-containing protein [Nostoc sp. 'Peltigera membranacea cyanobiont' 210A]OYD96374.1 choline dehydrogenase [Nostoc sp. 'Peltigera membranacea cyanobiont' 210A]
MSNQTFDYIIVGAGTTGCVIASRLSENPAINVLLLEAGDTDRKPAFRNSDLRSFFTDAWNTEADWQYVTEEEEYIGGRKLPISQGKVVGGGSSINGMIHVRGSRHDYDYWNYLGCEGWSYRQVLPYFKKMEDYAGGASEYHGVGGPIRIVDYTNPSPISQAFIEGAVELGFKSPPWDFNGAEQVGGVGMYQYAHTKDGKRCSASVAYLEPALNRPNLTLQTKAYVTRLLLEGTRVVGVEYLQEGIVHTVVVEREVILSAGPFVSPKLLMLAGIGPADHLKAHDIAVVVDLPGVGENLQDHVLLDIGYECKQEQPVPPVITEVGLFTHSRSGMEDTAPDLQFEFSPFMFGQQELFIGGTHFNCVPTLLRPHSKGSVTLRSKNPMDLAIVRTNYMQFDIDMETLMRGIELSREIMSTPPFEKMGIKELSPGSQVKTKQQLRESIRQLCRTEWHPSCTCKMGRDPMAVVDPQLRVYGIEGLRVADASIMPAVVSGNTNAACLMIGEKAADMISQGSDSRLQRFSDELSPSSLPLGLHSQLEKESRVIALADKV